MLLGSEEIERLIKDYGLISNYGNLHVQLQPTGFDLTVESIETFESAGEVDFDNTHRVLSDTKPVKLCTEFNQPVWLLKPGIYRVNYNEEINLHDLPYPVSIISCQRGTLMRNGCETAIGFWDYGYRGRGQTILKVWNPHGLTLHQNARISQCFFFGAATLKMYEGIYLNENLIKQTKDQ